MSLLCLCKVTHVNKNLTLPRMPMRNIFEFCNWQAMFCTGQSRLILTDQFVAFHVVRRCTSSRAFRAPVNVALLPCFVPRVPSSFRRSRPASPAARAPRTPAAPPRRPPRGRAGCPRPGPGGAARAARATRATGGGAAPRGCGGRGRRAGATRGGG